MKTLLSIILASVLLLGAYGQEGQLSQKEIKKLQKEQKKAEQEALREKNAEITNFMISHQRFVLEADYLSDKTGSRVPVQALINFILVDSVTGTLQLGSASTAGYNGVGGTTIDGNISNYKYNPVGKKKDSYSVSLNFNSPAGLYDITLMVTSDGYTDATIRGNWGGALNYHGKLVPLSESRIYKGTPSY